MVDWPLLPFYGCMCAEYVLMGFIWLILCGLHWRDLLRIQYWIGAVIFLGNIVRHFGGCFHNCKAYYLTFI